MQDSRAHPILVTGSHRSGTTWTGRMLAASRAVGLIMEPFVPIHHRPGICGARLRHWFPYFRPDDGDAFVAAVERMLRFDYRIAAGLRESRTARDFARLGRDVVQWRQFRARGARPLLKDPSALLLSPWLAARFGVQPVVLIRHPAAFVSSLQALGWRFSFDDLLTQRALLEDHLGAYETAMAGQVREQADIIDEGILVWNVLHQVIANFRVQHPDWIFVRHEDLSRAPAAGFRQLCERLSLPFDWRIQRRLDHYCGPANPDDATSPAIPVQRARSLRRNSAANITNWKRRLSAAEVRRIRDGTEPLARLFYDDSDW